MHRIGGSLDNSRPEVRPHKRIPRILKPGRRVLPEPSMPLPGVASPGRQQPERAVDQPTRCFASVDLVRYPLMGLGMDHPCGVGQPILGAEVWQLSPHHLNHYLLAGLVVLEAGSNGPIVMNPDDQAIQDIRGLVEYMAKNGALPIPPLDQGSVGGRWRGQHGPHSLLVNQPRKRRPELGKANWGGIRPRPILPLELGNVWLVEELDVPHAPVPHPVQERFN